MAELLQINFEIITQRLLEKYTLEDIFAILDLSDEFVVEMFQDRILEEIESFDVLCSTDFYEDEGDGQG